MAIINLLTDSLPAGIVIEPGSLADYRALARFHYRPGNPAGVCDVLRMTLTRQSVVDRFLNRPAAPQIVGVMVRTLPSLSCHLRDVATCNRYKHLEPHDAAVVLNREVRCISRVVIDPRLRGMGLAVRLVRHALEHPLPGTRITEALAAMGRVSPFFKHAGMTRYERPLRNRPPHARLIDALAHLGIEPVMLASQRVIDSHLADLAAHQQQWLLSELRRWRQATRRVPRRIAHVVRLHDLLNHARDELLFSPVYFAFSHDLHSKFTAEDAESAETNTGTDDRSIQSPHFPHQL